MTGEDLKNLDDAARLFNKLLMRTLPRGHALGQLFTGIMMIYFEGEESQLEELLWRCRPIIERCEASGSRFEQEMILNLVFLQVAAKAAKENQNAHLPR